MLWRLYRASEIDSPATRATRFDLCSVRGMALVERGGATERISRASSNLVEVSYRLTRAAATRSPAKPRPPAQRAARIVSL